MKGRTNKRGGVGVVESQTHYTRYRDEMKKGRNNVVRERHQEEEQESGSASFCRREKRKSERRIQFCIDQRPF